jgi:hypothetical protein
MLETYQHCPNCNEDGSLTKVPPVTSFFDKKTSTPQPQKTGALVTSIIEETKEEIKQEKERLKEYYNPK